MRPQLGIKIDHIASLRQMRTEEYPSLVEASTAILSSDADMLSMHLREDRMHIQDFDVETIKLVVKRYGKQLHLEIGVSAEMIDVAQAVQPEWLTFVAEKKSEKSEEGGIDLLDDVKFQHLKEAMIKLREEAREVKISLLIEAKVEQLLRAIELKPDAIEIHVAEFSKRFHNGDDCEKYIAAFKIAHDLVKKESITLFASRGLSRESVKELKSLHLFDAFFVGHAVVSEALFCGLSETIKQYVKMLDEEQIVASE